MNIRARVLLAATLLCTACGNPDTVPGYSRETAPDGRVSVSYADGLPSEEDTLVTLVEIGRYEADTSTIFEDLRDIAVDRAGRIHALDFQAAQIRVFRPDGSPDTTLGRRGEGPGELGNANGLRFGPDGTLWVNDHAKRMLLALNPDGTERTRLQSIVSGFGYRWGVVIDTAGVMWEPWSRQLEGFNIDLRATGIVEGTSRGLFLSLDPVTGARDSVDGVIITHRTFRATYPGGGGQIFLGLPFSGNRIRLLDTRHRVWRGSTEEYALARGTLGGDTTLVLTVAVPPVPLTTEDVDGWRTAMRDIHARVPAAEGALLEVMPENKPVLSFVFLDDVDRIWVGRTGPDGSPLRWDVFSPEGEFLAAVRAPAGITATLQPLVHGNRIYLLPTGEAGERYIVVAELPAGLRRAS